MNTFNIDYMQFSSNIKVIGNVATWEDSYKKSNMRFYERMTTYRNGVRMYTGNPNSDKKLIVLDGKTCDRLGVDAGFCDRVINEFGGTVSRIDLAMTTDKHIIERFFKDKDRIVSGLWQKMKGIVDDNKNLETVYVGDLKARGRKGIVRCYDKAVELGLDDCIMNRVEIELKQKHAQLATKRLSVGESIPSVMNSKFRIDAQWYTEIFTSEISDRRFALEPEYYEEEIHKKMAWLMKQVAPSLAYVMKYDDDNNTKNYDLFNAEVVKKLRMIGG